ncbi:hypothetical protein AB0L75_42385 [Streptomyces sp. NPDC052101]|uniref:hypothetical protein n=1 Tax=Streptomyces sp. NPDC052101 TaxID=3155763 RepID=UPI0034262994
MARLAGLGAGKKTAPPTKKAAAKKAPAKTAKKTAAPAKKTAAKKAPAAAAAPVAMPAEQEAPRSLYSARITFTTTPEQRRALELAKVDDGIDKTARIRAMVALWEQDDRLRRRVDKLARTME